MIDSIAAGRIKAVCFDLGNTLIEFGSKQVAYQYGELEKALTGLFGSCDAGRLKSIRDDQIEAPFSNGYRENDIATLCGELITGIYGAMPEPEQVDSLVRTRYESFLHVIELRDDILPVLERLRGKYRIALCSNYPCGRSIRDCLDNVGLTDMLETIVVSGEVGYVKPHPKPFQTMLTQLELAPADCVYVGDNWLADIQGAKRMGMGAILTTQYAPYKNFEPEPGDHEPNARIEHLRELEELLGA